MRLEAVSAEHGVTSLADRAYTAIQDKLIMLDIRPNDAIVEGDLAEQLGVGRTPVREALKRLEAERLVVSFPRRGTFATGVDVADLGHISEIRAHLEPVAARRAAEGASPTLRQLLLDMADKTDELDVLGIERHELMRWDLTVHRTIYRASRNPHLEDVLVRYDNLATRIPSLRHEIEVATDGGFRSKVTAGERFVDYRHWNTTCPIRVPKLTTPAQGDAEHLEVLRRHRAPVHRTRLRDPTIGGRRQGQVEPAFHGCMIRNGD